MSIKEIEIAKIHAFKNHPFKVTDDEKMEELVRSIKTNGVLTPVLVRPDGKDEYEMVSGHRRMHAAARSGLIVIPAEVKEMTDDEAIVKMVDANVQREEILPSERAYSFKMKMDALNRQGNRIDLTCGTEFHKLEDEKEKTRNRIGKEAGMSGRQVQKYIKLADLDAKLLELVDNKKLGINLAVEIANFDKELQGWIYEYYKDHGFLKPYQIEALKNCGNVGNIGQRAMIQILNNQLPENRTSGKVILSEKKLDKYFPPHFSAKEREKVIVGLLTKWHEERK
ncbi:ParB/RepB/Spo0J family partition protein [Lachnospiraceae bacterium C1.1]|nr:ParB/RepB/Spo0J family partition protein [Lachnospiraceae bacterium C1.1]